MPPSSGTSDTPRPSRPGWEPRDPTLSAPPPPARKRPPRAGRLRRALRTLFGLALLGALLLAGAFVAGYLLVDIPPANAAALAQSNVYLYRDGSPIARDGEVNRENVRLDQVPLDVRQAVLAAEDRDFHTSRAVDPKAMVRAAWNTVTGKGRQSGSTITQQYVKNYYLGQEQTLTRKAKEFFIAIKLGREKSAEDILQGYLNTSYFGRNAYGIQAAARAYYGKDVEQLDTAEGAYLASSSRPPAPTTSPPTPRTGARPSPAGTTSSTAWSPRAGSAAPTAPPPASPSPRPPAPPPASPDSAATSSRPSRST